MVSRSNIKVASQVKVVKTACNMCVTRCGLNVSVENGKIVKVTGMPEHPYNTLCVKAYAIPELVHSRERLINPLRKVDGKFKEVSWEEALDFAADKLTKIKQKYGAKAVNIHVGNPFIATQTEKVVRRFSDLYGTPNYTTGASFCFLARTIGHSLMCGAHLLPDFSQDTKCMLIWGSNPDESSPLMAEAIYRVRKEGAKLIVVDPRVIPLAKEADIHAQIRPGTDCALALGMLNVIIADGLYDRAFVEQWTVGFDRLVEHVKEYPPEKVEEITWVKAQTIRDMAWLYATNKPAAIAPGISMDHCTNGIQGIRAVATLMAITGNIDIPGGNRYLPLFRQSTMRLVEKQSKEPSIGADYPLFSKFTLESTAITLADAILTEKPYPIKALVVEGCDVVATFPNTSKILRMLSRLEFLLVIDIFMTETAKMADIVLPGTTFLERPDLRDWRPTGVPLIAITDRVIEPVGNSMEDWKIWRELGKRMGYREYFPWEETDELFRFLLERPNVKLEELKQYPGGWYYAERGIQKYLKEGFNTPSKKVEIYSRQMKDLGYDPIPTYHEPAESPVSRPDLVENYPLILVTGPRTVAYLHSQYRNLPSLRKLVPEPLIEINPQTAGSLGIADGNLVKVESLRGSIRIKAKLTKDIHPKVVSIQHGWSEANINYLTDDEGRDPVSGYPGFRSVMCRVISS